MTQPAQPRTPKVQAPISPDVHTRIARQIWKDFGVHAGSIVIQVARPKENTPPKLCVLAVNDHDGTVLAPDYLLIRTLSQNGALPPSEVRSADGRLICPLRTRAAYQAYLNRGPRLRISVTSHLYTTLSPNRAAGINAWLRNIGPDVTHDMEIDLNLYTAWNALQA